jgi:hypothetical protein
MTPFDDLFLELRRDWSHAQSPVLFGGKRSPFRLRCDVADFPAPDEEVSRIPGAGTEELRAFWAIARQADLFKDVDYGHWGLSLLAPPDALEATRKELDWRPASYLDGDLVFGRLLGDSELLVATNDGTILVARPLDQRSDWPVVGDSLSSFLARYIASRGDKFWEVAAD